MPGIILSPQPTLKNDRFSLVEIVVVVTLLGMAAAFAVPRFTSLGNRMRASEVVALGANLRDAAQLAHARFVASGSTLASVKLKGRAVALKNGYPDASNGGIGNAVVDWGGFTTKTNPAYVVYLKTGAPIDAQCSVTYTAAPEPTATAAITDVNITGC